MELSVTTLSGKSAGKIDLPDAVFGLEPRTDVLQRMVSWQLAKRRAGSGHTQGRSDVTMTGAKMYRQKGTGRARHHAASAPQFRGGGKAHGPKARDHAIGLPKKVRALALRHALSSKAKNGELIVVDQLAVKDAKTKVLAQQLADLGLGNALVIGGAELDDGFKRAASNIVNVDVLPVVGINVYDILRRNKLVLSKDAVEALKERLQ